MPLLNIKSRGKLQSLKRALNNKKGSFPSSIKSRFYLRNNSAAAIKANFYYSLPLFFDIPKGYFNSNGYWLDSACSVEAMTKGAAGFNTSTPYNSLIYNLIAGQESIYLRLQADNLTSEELEQARYIDNVMIERTQIIYKDTKPRATPAVNIGGAFYSPVSIEPGETGLIFFNRAVSVGCYFDSLENNRSSVPFYINNNGVVSSELLTTSKKIDFCASNGGKAAAEQTRKVIASIEPAERATGVSSGLDWRSSLVSNNSRRYYDPLTACSGGEYSAAEQGGTAEQKELVALPCLFIEEGAEAPKKIKDQYFFYSSGLYKEDTASQAPADIDGHLFAEIANVINLHSSNGDEALVGPVVYPWALPSHADGYRRPLVRIVSHAEPKENQGF